MRNSVLTKETIAKAKSNGISYITLYNRLFEYGYDEERATTEPPKEIFGRNKEPLFTDEEIAYAQTELNLTYGGLYARVKKRGLTKKHALSFPSTTKKKNA